MATEGTAFGAALRRLRLAAGLTQERLAERAGVSAKAIIALENDSGRTPRLETVTRLADALGLDRDDRARLLAAARPPGPAPTAPGPEEQPRPAPVVPPTPIRRGAVARAPTPTALPTTSLAEQVGQAEPTRRPALVALAPRRQDWGEAPDVGELHGRAPELATLGRWVGADGCRLVAIVGMGGVGKTALAGRLARERAADFEAMYWRSARNAPPPAEWLSRAIPFLSDQQVLPAEGEEARLRQLLALLRARRCLLVLDNFETVLEPGAPDVGYRVGYEGYGQLLQWLGEAEHRSCLIITSREVPPEAGPRAGLQGPVRTLRLGGIDTTAGRALLADRGLEGDAAAWEALVARYGGNALALQMVAETIAELFGGQIVAFLAQGEAVFGDIRRLLDAQVVRLSDAERAVLDWLAIEREPVDFRTLLADLGPVLSRGAALEALEALRRRSLLEQGEEGATVTLQPVVLEYATERLVEQLAGEIARGQPARLVSRAVIKAQSRDYVRQSQERMLGEPVLRLLTSRHGEAGAAERLLALLDGWRGRPTAEQGYGPGNVVNLLRLLRGDLRGLDLARLTLRQVYLALDAHDASLAGAHLSGAVLAEAFDHPLAVALSMDGSYLVAGTFGGEVRLWHLPDQAPILSIPAHAGVVMGVALSDDGRLIASCSLDGTVKLWQAPDGQLLAVLRQSAGAVRGVALSADGAVAAYGQLDGTVTAWDVSRRETIAAVHAHDGAVWGVALSGNGRVVASGGLDGTVTLWEPASGRAPATLHAHEAGVWGVALGDDGRLLATGSLDGTMKLWDRASGRLLATGSGHVGGVWRVALSRDGRLVATGGGDGTVRLWDAPGGLPLATLTGHASTVRGVALAADGRLAASGSLDGTIKLWETASGHLLGTLQGYAGAIWGVALSGGGQLAASGSLDGIIRVWDPSRGQVVASWTGHVGGVWGVALSEDGRVLASGGEDGAVAIWDADTGRPLARLHGHTGGVRSVALSADGGVVVSGSLDGTVGLWDVATGRRLASFQRHPGGVRSVAISRDGQRIVSGGEDALVRLWAPGRGEPLATLHGHAGAVWGVALSGDGRLVASGSLDGSVRLWDASDGRPLTSCAAHAGGVWAVALSGDGRLLTSGGGDGVGRLWDTAGAPLGVLEGHHGPVAAVAVSDDGQVVATGGGDGQLKLWQAPGGASLGTLRPERCYERLDITGLTGITAAQRGALLALGAVDRSVPASMA